MLVFCVFVGYTKTTQSRDVIDRDPVAHAIRFPTPGFTLEDPALT